MPIEKGIITEEQFFAKLKQVQYEYQGNEYENSDTLIWLATQIFTAFPKEVRGLKFFTINCGRIYYQRVLSGGSLGPQVGIYRYDENEACGICMLQDKNWKCRIIDDTVVYNSKFQITGF